ncbi:PorT family protein [Fulvivirga sp. M361]|uniref:porin family protein n=1 Tax=Fulvivirga sp. M361 TaxID=2594266 RepID=UPI00117A2928|nr:porin family protein [Fulvivirga sp. M361]TRX61844.1 PorT family protein [Fulvivirga sp. M361]
MTRILTLFFLIVAFSQSGQAQNAVIGLKAGTNISSLGGDTENLSTKWGFHGGFFSSLKLSEKLSLRPEIIASNQGARNSGNGDVKFTYWYLNAPVLLQYQRATPVAFNIGVQFGTVLNAKTKGADGDQDVTSQLKNIDFSAVIGIEYELSSSLSLEARYNYGISNASRNVIPGDDKFQNRVFQLSLAYVLTK